jgi:hypothetical protein
LAERIERGLLSAEHQTGKHLSCYILSSAWNLESSYRTWGWKWAAIVPADH